MDASFHRRVVITLNLPFCPGHRVPSSCSARVSTRTRFSMVTPNATVMMGPKTHADIIQFIRGRANDWVQDEGLALVLLLDRFAGG